MKRIRDTRDYKIRGILFEDSDLNKLKMLNKESLDHWITKALVFHLLRCMSHDVVSEFEITGMGVGDLLDLTTNVQYEVENRSHPKYVKEKTEQYIRMGVEIIVIPIKKLPVDLKERYKALKEYVWE